MDMFFPTSLLKVECNKPSFSVPKANFIRQMVWHEMLYVKHGNQVTIVLQIYTILISIKWDVHAAIKLTKVIREKVNSLVIQYICNQVYMAIVFLKLDKSYKYSVFNVDIHIGLITNVYRDDYVAFSFYVIHDRELFDFHNIAQSKNMFGVPLTLRLQCCAVRDTWYYLL